MGNDCNGQIDDDPSDRISVYLDADGDGYGDDGTESLACEVGTGQAEQGGDCDDEDGADGVLDGADLCPQTAMGVTFDQSGCSGTQYVAYTVGSCSSYSNHGQYVRAVTHAANAAVRLGLLSANEKGVITRNAAKSCGQ